MKISSIVWCEIFLVLVLSPLVVLGLPVVQRPKLVSVGTAVTSLKNKLQSHHPFQLFDKRYSTQLLLAAKDGADYGAGSFLTRSAFFKLLGGGIFSFPLLLELYSRVGSFGVKLSQDNLKPPDTGTWNDVEHATIVFHGAGGQDQYTDALMERLSSQSASSSDKSKYYSTMIEWSEYSSNILQASFNGAELGRQVATKLLENAPNLKTIHLIGISVGSFAADAAAGKLKAATTEQQPYLQMTFLDPFTQKGILGLEYGNREFGSHADFAQQYLNTDDPVPSTNKRTFRV